VQRWTDALVRCMCVGTVWVGIQGVRTNDDGSQDVIWISQSLFQMTEARYKGAASVGL
jgi:hypothetical protein